jgi:DNA invertase Pin-like site-specific DNA recombinase
MEFSTNQDKLQNTIEHQRDEIAKRWYQEVALMSDSPHEANQIRDQFHEMTTDIISLLINSDIDTAEAQVIGASLAKFSDLHPEVLGKSLKIISQLLMEGLSIEDFKSIHPRLTIRYPQSP